MQRMQKNQQRNRRLALVLRNKTINDNEAPKESEPTTDTNKELD
jgi:hypothetical protein